MKKALLLLLLASNMCSANDSASTNSPKPTTAELLERLSSDTKELANDWGTKINNFTKKDPFSALSWATLATATLVNDDKSMNSSSDKVTVVVALLSGVRTWRTYRAMKELRHEYDKPETTADRKEVIKEEMAELQGAMYRRKLLLLASIGGIISRNMHAYQTNGGTQHVSNMRTLFTVLLPLIIVGTVFSEQVINRPVRELTTLS